MSVTLREPARPSRIRKSPRAHRYVVATVCIGAFMCQLDASIVTLALPRLGRDLHATVGGVEWVALAYLLVLIATVATVGHLADAFGRKLLYTFGFGVFTLASVACGLAPDLPVLIAARVVQALGAAMLQANSVALIAEAMPRRVLPRALGVQGTAQALGLALGPAFGGLLLALAGWRLIFLINVPAGVLGLAAGWILLPRSRSRREIGGGDVGGALLLAAAAGGTLAYLSLATRYGFDNAVLLALLMAGVVAGALFLVHERRHAHPLIELSMLRRPALSIGLSSSLLAYTVLFVTLFVVSYFLSADRVTPALAGLELALLPVGIGVAAPIAGRLASRIGAGPLTSGGLTLAGAGMLVVALGHGTASLLVGLVVTGLGLGTFNPANYASIMVAAPGGYTGLVGGILNMTRGAGTALGVAGASVIYTMAVGVSGADAATAGLAAASHGLTVSLLVFGAIALATGAALALRGSRASARLGGSSAATDERRSRPLSPTAPLTNEAARGR